MQGRIQVAILHRSRGHCRGGRRGGRVAALPRQCDLAPIFRPPTIPKLVDSSVALQNKLNQMIRGADDHLVAQT